MMQCPKCGADGRVMHVQEEGPGLRTRGPAGQGPEGVESNSCEAAGFRAEDPAVHSTVGWHGMAALVGLPTAHGGFAQQNGGECRQAGNRQAPVSGEAGPPAMIFAGEGPDSAVVTYVCPNSRCSEYRREIGTERIDRGKV